jgi:hypothetical protein
MNLVPPALRQPISYLMQHGSPPTARSAPGCRNNS